MMGPARGEAKAGAEQSGVRTHLLLVHSRE